MQCEDVFKVLKGKGCHPRILYPTKLSFKNEEKIKIFPDNQNLTDFITSGLFLQEIIKEAFETEMKEH